MAKQKVEFRSGDRSLHGTVYGSEEPTGAGVVMIHGAYANSSTLRHYAKPLAREGATCLAFDLGGHGKSSGNMADLSVNEHTYDVVAAYDFLSSQEGVDPQRIGMIGMSFGGYLAALVATRRRVQALLLRAAPLYPDELRHRPRHTYTDEQALGAEPSPDNAALKALQAFGGSVALVAMENDAVVPASVTDAYRAACPGSDFRVIPEAGHSLDAESKPLFQEIALEWAAQL